MKLNPTVDDAVALLLELRRNANAEATSVAVEVKQITDFKVERRYAPRAVKYEITTIVLQYRKELA